MLPGLIKTTDRRNKMKYIGNVVLESSNVSREDYRKIVDFVESLTEEQRDMVHELQEMYEDVSFYEREYGEMDG